MLDLLIIYYQKLLRKVTWFCHVLLNTITPSKYASQKSSKPLNVVGALRSAKAMWRHWKWSLLVTKPFKGLSWGAMDTWKYAFVIPSFVVKRAPPNRANKVSIRDTGKWSGSGKLLSRRKSTQSTCAIALDHKMSEQLIHCKISLS